MKSSPPSEFTLAKLDELIDLVQEPSYLLIRESGRMRVVDVAKTLKAKENVASN